MSSNDIAASVREHVIAEYLADEDASDLTTDYDLITSGVIDSLGLVRLIAHIGQTYQVPVDDLEIGPEDFRTIDAIAALIEKHAPAAVA